MISELDTKLEEIKMFSLQKSEREIKSKIYSLNFTAEYANKLPQNLLILAHVILHTQASYTKPFADISEIKRIHDIVANKLENHKIMDILDN